MHTVVSIVVYNRYSNIKRWITCWQQCKLKGELVIVHNHYGDQTLMQKFKTLCDDNKIKYVPRDAPGFDIGAFMDVCKQRLTGFPDYDYLLWCTDDCLPMQKDFITPFIDKIKQPGVGLSCMQISTTTQAPHVRTTGFCISKEVAAKITFPVDPIKTKQDCYLFEHRAKDTFTNQIRAMGLSCEQVAPNETSPLWDTGYHLRLDRKAEHEKVFGSPIVTFVCTIYKQYPQIISSLLMQTNPNWELWLIHNGPGKCAIPDDKRIKFIQTEVNTENYGHQNRRDFLQKVETEFCVITNADNWYSPPFVENMLRGFKPETVATYSEKMAHSYINWGIINCRPERGFIDCGSVMLRTEEAKAVGFNDVLSHSADWTFFNDIIKRHGKQSFQEVKGMLFVHN